VSTGDIERVKTFQQILLDVAGQEKLSTNDKAGLIRFSQYLEANIVLKDRMRQMAQDKIYGLQSNEAARKQWEKVRDNLKNPNLTLEKLIKRSDSASVKAIELMVSKLKIGDFKIKTALEQSLRLRDGQIRTKAYKQLKKQSLKDLKKTKQVLSEAGQEEFIKQQELGLEKSRRESAPLVKVQRKVSEGLAKPLSEQEAIERVIKLSESDKKPPKSEARLHAEAARRIQKRKAKEKRKMEKAKRKESKAKKLKK
ncbi:hypothetical protein KAU11_04600, partial [Candidatus Babeliales bacterium]|nr:hypothetical protein [Candidatus Babeliales bacterium]